jgi:hypothetical protein
MTKKLATMPFGSVIVDDAWKEKYGNIVRGSSLPSLKSRKSYPKKHPMIDAFSGHYSIPECLPDWWISMCESMNRSGSEHAYLSYQLMNVTAKEFISGQIDENVWKGFRQSMRSEARKKYPQSPKIGGILASIPDNDNLSRYNSRGSDTECELVISNKIEDMIYMSNGQNWTSCQHFLSGGYRNRLEGNLADPYSTIACVVKKGDDIQSFDVDNMNESGNPTGTIIARVVVRVVHSILDMEPMLYLDRPYGNNETCIRNMLCSIIALCKSKDIDCFASSHIKNYIGYDKVNNSLPVFGYPIKLDDVRSHPYMDSLEIDSLSYGESSVFYYKSSSVGIVDMDKVNYDVPQKLEDVTTAIAVNDKTAVTIEEKDDANV